MKIIKANIIWAILVLLFAFSTRMVYATPMAEITYLEKHLGGDVWEYDYTVFNTSDPVQDMGVDLYEIFFSFDSDISLSVIDLPADWDSIDGPGFVDTFSYSPGAPPFGADIAPGTSLGGFVFQFDSRVGDLAFDATFANPDDPGNPFVDNGTTTPVPEPATILLMFSGLAGMGALGRRRWGLKRT